MEFNPEALQAMIESLNFGSSPEQALEVYCRTAGVVMVPEVQARSLKDRWVWMGDDQGD